MECTTTTLSEKSQHKATNQGVPPLLLVGELSEISRPSAYVFPTRNQACRGWQALDVLPAKILSPKVLVLSRPQNKQGKGTCVVLLWLLILYSVSISVLSTTYYWRHVLQRFARQQEPMSIWFNTVLIETTIARKLRDDLNHQEFFHRVHPHLHHLFTSTCQDCNLPFSATLSHWSELSNPGIHLCLQLFPYLCVCVLLYVGECRMFKIKANTKPQEWDQRVVNRVWVVLGDWEKQRTLTEKILEYEILLPDINIYYSIYYIYYIILLYYT